ncbi:MAG TPA: S1 RNA-binding domain-containing protein [Candidatus Obscuribacterales bacterium]
MQEHNDNLNQNSKITQTSVEPNIATSTVSRDSAKAVADLSIFEPGLTVSAKVTVVTDRFVRAEITHNGHTAPAFMRPQHVHHLRHTKPSDLLQIGDEILAKVVEVDAAHGNVVISLKNFKRDEFFANRKAGDLLVGKVIGLAPFGVFIDVGACEGLLPASEIPLSTQFQMGDEVTAWFAFAGEKGLRLTLKDPAQSCKKESGSLPACPDNNHKRCNLKDRKSPRHSFDGKRKAGERSSKPGANGGKSRRRFHSTGNWSGNGDDESDPRPRRRTSLTTGKPQTWLVIPAADGAQTTEPTLADVWPA